MQKRTIGIAAICAGIAAILALGSGYPNLRLGSKKKDVKLVTAILNWIPQAQFSGMYVADEKGQYADSGLDVTLKPFADGVDAVKELEEGRVEFIVLAGTELLFQRGQGKRIKAIGAIYQTSPHAFASLAEKNIKSPVDMRGKVLGSKGGNNEALVRYQGFLNAFNIPTEDVTFKNLDFGPSELDDLLAGRADVVDVYRTDQLYLFEQQHIPYNLILPEQYNFSAYGDVLVTRDDLILSDPELVRNFVQATFAGWRYALDHRDEALAIMAEHEVDQYRDATYEKRILDESAPLIEPTGGQRLGGMDFTLWKRAYEEANNTGIIKDVFDVSEIYTNEFIR